MTPEKLLSRHSLANGLTLTLWDLSRPVAGDRWYVALEARITIALKEAHLPAELVPRAGEVAGALGPEVVFSQKDERNFIAAPEVSQVLQEMETRVLDLAAHYLGQADFAPRLIRRRYARNLEEQRGHRPHDGRR
jgi:hypothetical protein